MPFTSCKIAASKFAKMALAAPLLFAFQDTLATAQETRPTSAIPVEAFAALESFSNARISPSGDKLAYYVVLDGKREIFVQNIDGTNPMKVPPPKDANFFAFYWGSDDLLILQTQMAKVVARFGPDVITQTRVLSVNLKNGEFNWLGKPAIKKRSNDKEYASQLERIVDFLPDDPDHILIGLDLDLDVRSEVYRVNIHNGKRKLVKEDRRGIQRWYTDANSEVRLGYGFEGERRFAYFKNSQGEWSELDDIRWADNYEPYRFGDDTNQLLVRGLTDNGTYGLFELDISSGEIVREVFAHSEVDIEGTISHPITRQFAGIQYTKDYDRVEYYDPELKQVQKIIDKALPNTVNAILNRATQKNWYLISARSDTDPGAYYILDRDGGQLFFVASARANIDPAEMAPVSPVTIPARDGTSVPGYLTLPKTRATSGEPGPAIVLPHGGPHARDTADWDFEAQFYASRGYTVLMPNFRGSTGYGPSFENAGRNQWGGLMQNDITDATKWLIAQGYADPERICIVGSSFGGYAALMGVIEEPDLYRCAISVNGVTDLARLKRNDLNTVGGRVWIETMGLEGKGDEEVSPWHRAEEIDDPVLLISARDDARVPWKMSEDLHKRLRGMKKQSSFVKIDEGTHGMVTSGSRLEWLRAAEKFLGKHIGG